jgi:hypothetical protein
MKQKNAVGIAQEATSNIKDPVRRAEILIAAMQADATRELVAATTSLRYAINQIFLDGEQARKQERDEDPGRPAFLRDLGSEVQRALTASGSVLLKDAARQISTSVVEALSEGKTLEGGKS